MLSKNQIRRLENFNKLVDRLINSRFIKDSNEKDPRRHFIWQKSKQTGKLEFSYRRDRIHNEETIMAFILTLRQLIQRDPVSIGEMAKLYEEMPIDRSYKARFRSLRQNLNNYLQSLSFNTLADDDPTIEKILRTIIYGEYAHLDRTKRELIEEWKTYEGDWDMIAGEFEAALYQCTNLITPIKELNEEVLRQYSSSSEK
jgi:hypothetical protein